MTLSGRTSGPRGFALRCPGCGKSMKPIELDEANAEVDVCDACGGMWVDWFDGEVRAIATETLRVSSPDLNAPASSNEEVAVGACPRCTKQLVPEQYVMTSDVQRDSTRPERTLISGAPTGAELLRCEDCMGAFVSRASAEVLSFLSASDEAPMSRGPESLKPLPWERFVTVIKSLLGVTK